MGKLDLTKFTDGIQNGKAVMRLDRHIGPNPKNPYEQYIDGSAFAEEMYYHKKNGLKCEVRINSPGGSVVQGYNIIEAVTDVGADTHVYGIAASMAGMILTTGKHRTADAHAIGMIHSSQSNSGSDKMVAVINSSLKEILMSRTKFGEAKITAMMTEGDHAFDASEMLEAGMIDKVIPSTIKVEKRVNASASELFAIFGSYSDTNNNKPMNLFEKIFGGATEEEGVTNALKLKDEKQKADAKVAELTSKLQAAENKVTELTSSLQARTVSEAKQKATDLITEAINSKVLTLNDTEKASMIEMATANYDQTKMMIERIRPGKKFVAETVINADGKGVEKTYAWLAKNDPERLKQIAETDPEMFNRLSDEYNESQKVK